MASAAVAQVPAAAQRRPVAADRLLWYAVWQRVCLWCTELEMVRLGGVARILREIVNTDVVWVDRVSRMRAVQPDGLHRDTVAAAISRHLKRSPLVTLAGTPEQVAWLTLAAPTSLVRSMTRDGAEGPMTALGIVRLMTASALSAPPTSRYEELRGVRDDCRSALGPGGLMPRLAQRVLTDVSESAMSAQLIPDAVAGSFTNAVMLARTRLSVVALFAASWLAARYFGQPTVAAGQRGWLGALAANFDAVNRAYPGPGSILGFIDPTVLGWGVAATLVLDAIVVWQTTRREYSTRARTRSWTSTALRFAAYVAGTATTLAISFVTNHFQSKLYAALLLSSPLAWFFTISPDNASWLALHFQIFARGRLLPLNLTFYGAYPRSIVGMWLFDTLFTSLLTGVPARVSPFSLAMLPLWWGILVVMRNALQRAFVTF